MDSRHQPQERPHDSEALTPPLPEPDAVPSDSPTGDSPEPAEYVPSRAVLEALDWVQTIVTSIILVSLIFSLAARVIGVLGPSMETTLYTGQKLLISDLFYTPKYGDIVVFTKKDIHLTLATITEDEPLVKRIIATEGQTVDVNYDQGLVYVDGQALDEPYIREATKLQGTLPLPCTVPSGFVFVMGDNRNHSTDSRAQEIGLIDTRYILGKVLLRVWPLAQFGSVR
ncbi:MAG: signal peptidase I [Oscillospiraceae bacterium]|jgi:signal peptidase I|nr:signal peptidase I [Oscillospiraceae bacterium]